MHKSTSDSGSDLSEIPCLWYANNMQMVLWGIKNCRTFAPRNMKIKY